MMSFLFDNLLSVLIAGAVGLALVSVTVGRSEATRDTTRFYGHQRAQAGFSSVLEFDLQNAGIGTPAGAAAVVEATPTRLAFYGAVDRAGTTGLVEYRVSPAGTLDGVAVFAVDRYVDGVRTGGARSLSRFDVSTLTAAGAPAAPADARQLRVDAEWVLAHPEPGGARARQALRRSAWSTVAFPLGLHP